MGGVWLVLGLGVIRDGTKGVVTITQDIYIKPLFRAIRYGKLRPCVHTWYGNKNFARLVGGEAAEQGGQAVFPGLDGPCSVSRASDPYDIP